MTIRRFACLAAFTAACSILVGIAQINLARTSIAAQGTLRNGDDRLVEMLEALGSGNVVAGPALWASDSVPGGTTRFFRVVHDPGLADVFVTVVNRGQTEITLFVNGSNSIGVVKPGESLSAICDLNKFLDPAPGDFSFTVTDTSGGSETRFAWVVRR